VIVPDSDEIQSALSASWGLMRGRADALRALNLTADGFWNSFFAMVVALPALLALWTGEAIELAPGAGIVGERVGLVLRFAVIEAFSWVLPIVVVAWALNRIGLRNRIAAFVIANNWGSALMVWIILPIMLVYRLVPSMMEIAALLMFLLFIASLALFWRLNNAVLAQGAVAPTLAVAAMVLMSIVIDYWLRLALAIP
jgi:hypothetical protein